MDGVVIRSGHSYHDIDDLMARSNKRSSSEGGSGSSGSSGGGGGGGSSYGSGYFSGGASGASYVNGGNGFGAHYDVLFGVVTGESIWRFSAHDIQNGFEGERRDKIIRTYVRNAYNYHLNEIFFTVSWLIIPKAESNCSSEIVTLVLVHKCSGKGRSLKIKLICF